MIAGMINCAQGLGSIVGPVGGGAIYEALGFPWMMTIIGFIQLGVVSVYFCQKKCQTLFNFT